jgi:hypothetical protein
MAAKTPNPKLQAPEKIQAPSSKLVPGFDGVLELGPWLGESKMRSNAQRRPALPPGGIELAPEGASARKRILFLTPRPEVSWPVLGTVLLLRTASCNHWAPEAKAKLLTVVHRLFTSAVAKPFQPRTDTWRVMGGA